MKTESKGTHTPGPWEVEEPSKGFNGYIIQGPITKDSFGEELATLRCWEDRVDQNAQQKANARLIAAAPEMYEVLEMMVKAFNVKEIDPLIAMATIERAKHIISKAEGKIK